MEKKLELRVITADTIQKVVKFMVETGTEEIVGKLLFETELPNISWGELRQKADLSAEDLKELQAEYQDPRYAALVIEKETGEFIISQDVVTMKDLYKELMHLAADDKKWNKTKELVAYLYQTDSKTIGEMSFKEIKDLFTGLSKDETFTEALS